MTDTTKSESHIIEILDTFTQARVGGNSIFGIVTSFGISMIISGSVLHSQTKALHPQLCSHLEGFPPRAWKDNIKGGSPDQEPFHNIFPSAGVQELRLPH